MWWSWNLIGCVGSLLKAFIEMTTNQPMLPSVDDEIDLREVFAALQRRWGWVLGGGFLGLALAVGAVYFKPRLVQQVQGSLVLDVAEGPCYLRSRKLSIYAEPSVVGLSCFGELQSARQSLIRLVKSSSISTTPGNGVTYSVSLLQYDKQGKDKSPNHLHLRIVGPSNLARKISDELTLIDKSMTLEIANKAKANGIKPLFGPDWIRVEKPSEPIERSVSFSRTFALGLLGGLVLGAGSALIADRRSNRVFSQAELLRRLGHPLRLGLPAVPWTSPAVPVLVGQLATQLDQTLSWRVLSIARQHEAVAPLTQLLQQQGGADLQCNSADPLLAAVLRMESSDRPIGLLLVVEPGFNSARALEGANLLISQMSNVQAVGVVLISAPLPVELSSSVVG